MDDEDRNALKAEGKDGVLAIVGDRPHQTGVGVPKTDRAKLERITVC